MKQLIFSFSIMFLVLFSACADNTSKANTEESNVEYETYHNNRYDYSVEYPDFLIPQGEATGQDGQKFISENQEILMLVYYEYKNDFNADGEHLSIGEAYMEDLKPKEGILKKKLEDDHYSIEYKVEDMFHADYAILHEDSYFNIRFEYPETEKNSMEGVIEHIINSFKVKILNADVVEHEGNVSAGGLEDMFPSFLEGFVNDCYWGKNFNSLLRNKDETLAIYIHPKMDVRRYYAPGTVAKLGTRDEDFGFSKEDDFMTRPRATGDLIFEYVNDDSSPCELIFSNSNVIYYKSINSVPDVVVNNETFETRPVKIAYPEAQIMAVYLPNTYGNPRGFYFIHTPDGWKLAFVDDSLCGA